MFYPPRIVAEALPEGERDAARFVDHSLHGLTSTVGEFEAAIQLYIFAGTLKAEDNESSMIVRRWPHIAARVAALCLYDFWMATQTINGNLLARCPSIRAMMDMASKKNAQTAFEKAFPTAAKIRYTAAHPAELNATPEKLRANAAQIGTLPGGLIGGDPDGFVTVQSSICNHRYMTTFKGQALTFDLTMESVSSLKAILQNWYRTFEPVATETQRLRSEQKLRTAPRPPEGKNGHR